MTLKIHFMLLISVCVISGIIEDCPSSLESCNWCPWEPWSSCSSSCGGGSQSRSRSLCCERDWIAAGTCDSNCGVSSSGYYEYRKCSMFCYNGGTIGTDYWGSRYCRCKPGFAGYCCETNINECQSSPCQNGGTCKDHVNYYSCDCPWGYYGDQCETEFCQPLPADVIFVLDSSVSQTKTEFQHQLEFVKEFVRQVPIGPSDIRISVITFSFKAQIEFYLNAYNTEQDIVDAISKINFRPGATFTDKGLYKVKEVIDEQNGGGVERSSGKISKRYVLLLTDGMSNNRRATVQAANDVKKYVDKIVAIGIGPQVSHKELLDISSPGDKFTSQYVFSVQNFNSLFTIIRQLVNLKCEKCLRSSQSDIVFLLDASPYMDAVSFRIAVADITHLLENLEDYGHPKGERIAVASFDDTINVEINLDDILLKDELFAQVNMMTTSEGGSGRCDELHCGMNMSAAIDTVLENIFGYSQNARLDSRQFLIVLSNGRFTEKVDTAHIQQKLSEDNVRFFIIGVGERCLPDALLPLVTDPSQLFLTPFENDVSSLDILQSEFQYNVCIGPKVSHKELLDISSPGDKFTSQYVFSVQNFNSLFTIIRQLVNLKCEKCLRSSQSDIVFLLDASPYMDAVSLHFAVADITHLVKNLEYYGQPKSERIAVASFDDTINVEINLDLDLLKDELFAQVNMMTTSESGSGTCDELHCGMNMSAGY